MTCRPQEVEFLSIYFLHLLSFEVVSRLLCNLKTIQDIFMKLQKNVTSDDVQTICERGSRGRHTILLKTALVDTHQMPITAKYSPHQFTGYGENAI